MPWSSDEVQVTFTAGPFRRSVGPGLVRVTFGGVPLSPIIHGYTAAGPGLCSGSVPETENRCGPPGRAANDREPVVLSFPHGVGTASSSAQVKSAGSEDDQAKSASVSAVVGGGVSVNVTTGGVVSAASRSCMSASSVAESGSFHKFCNCQGSALTSRSYSSCWPCGSFAYDHRCPSEPQAVTPVVSRLR